MAHMQDDGLIGRLRETVVAHADRVREHHGRVETAANLEIRN